MIQPLLQSIAFNDRHPDFYRLAADLGQMDRKTRANFFSMLDAKRLKMLKNFTTITRSNQDESSAGAVDIVIDLKKMDMKRVRDAFVYVWDKV